MKSYVTPMLSFESFELTSNTASACGKPTRTPTNRTCGVTVPVHEFFSKIGSIKAGPAMQVSAAHAHIFHGFQRIVDSFPGHFTIP